MHYFFNPAGRAVAVDGEKEIEKYSHEPGFRQATPEEEADIIQTRTQIAKQVSTQQALKTGSGVYMATVSQVKKDGYGTASKKMMQELTKLGVDISFHNAGQSIALLFHNPYSILRLEAPYRMLFTMFESDKLPDDWRPYLEAADVIIVPSKWCASVFKKFGFETKVIPLGYDADIFQYHPRVIKRDHEQDFVFLHYNAFNIRKGFLEVFKAFTQAFEKTEPVRMIFKTTLENNPIPITKSEYPNIEIVHGEIGEPELVSLLHRADCFVYPSRGEGFGLTPLEAMATGIPAIVPNAHGITEYFDADYMYEVKVKEECPAIYSRYKSTPDHPIDVGKMVICDVDHLAQQMRYAYEHQEETREKGRLAAEYVKNWTFERTAVQLKALFDGVDSTALKQRPLKNILNLETVK